AVEWLDQVAVEQTDVDRVGRRGEIAVGADEDRPDLRMEPPGLAQQIQAAHLRRRLVRDRERGRLLALVELLEQVYRRRRTVEARHVVAVSGEGAVEVALERTRHPRITPPP